jgi:hypothetical protein
MNLFVILVLVIIFVATNLNLNLKDKMTNMAKYLDINIQENFIDRKVDDKKVDANIDINKIDEKNDFDITPCVVDKNLENDMTPQKDDSYDVEPFKLKVEEIKQLYQNIKEQINNLST